MSSNFKMKGLNLNHQNAHMYNGHTFNVCNQPVPQRLPGERSFKIETGKIATAEEVYLLGMLLMIG